MSQRAMKKLCIVMAVLLVIAIVGLIITLIRNSNRSVAIKSVAIGDSIGQIETEWFKGKRQYVIVITLPDDYEFTKCIANIELPKGAAISSESPCLVDYLGGRPVLNLTLENRDLIIVNGDKSRNYGFKIDLEKEK